MSWKTNKIKWLKGLTGLFYHKLFKINDTPQKIALGLGLGVFSGILPGTGPLVGLFLAFIFRANCASSLLGSLLTNTWLSFLTFFAAAKIGAATLGLNWQQVQRDWNYFLKEFHWLSLLKLSALKIILPIIAGYLEIAFCLGLFAYLAALTVLKYLRKGDFPN